MKSKSFYYIKNDLDHFEKDFDFDFDFAILGKTIFDFDLDRLEKRFRNCLLLLLVDRTQVRDRFGFPENGNFRKFPENIFSGNNFAFPKISGNSLFKG